MKLADLIIDRVLREAENGPYPERLNAVLSAPMAEEALAEISSWTGYEPTPVHDLPKLAAALDVGRLSYKDEGPRLGLGSFKALGGAYAVLRLAADRLEETTGSRPALSSIRMGAYIDALRPLTVVTATDGNHGRSVAWGAKMAGCDCRIYIHAEVSEGRKAAMEAFGATVVRVDGDYDDSVRICAQEAAENGWFIVSDTSYDGYMDVPKDVMAGYSVLASEALEQLGAAPPTHIFVQAGVGGLAAAVCARFWQVLGPRRPKIVIVEPTRAACVLESARCDKPMAVPIEEETIMAGLSCGEISLLAWDVLSVGASASLTIGEEAVGPVMRLLTEDYLGTAPIVAGESAVPGLIGALGAATDPNVRSALEIDIESHIMTIGCEGATDPAIYETIMDLSEPFDEDLKTALRL